MSLSEQVSIGEQSTGESSSNQASLFRFTRDDSVTTNLAVIDPQQTGQAPSKYFLGSFLEHLGHGMIGGVLAELLVNPTFSRFHNLSEQQVEQLRGNAKSLTQLYLSGGDAAALGVGWTPQIMPTGFATAVFDDATRDGVPFGWSPLGAPGAVTAVPGRLGGAVRLAAWSGISSECWSGIDEGAAGIRQGFFPPIRRCRAYDADVWVRIARIDELGRGRGRDRLAPPREYAGREASSGGMSRCAAAHCLWQRVAETERALRSRRGTGRLRRTDRFLHPLAARWRSRAAARPRPAQSVRRRRRTRS